MPSAPHLREPQNGDEKPVLGEARVKEGIRRIALEEKVARNGR